MAYQPQKWSTGAIAAALLILTPSAALSGPYEDAAKASSARDYDKAVKLFRPLAEADNDDAQWYMGTFYRKGQGVEKSYKTALYWYDRSARNGDVDSQYELAKLYYFGNGTPEDHKTAFKWYLAAAEQGHKNAAYDVGYAYKNGDGTRQSYKKALKWYQKSADYGNNSGRTSLGIMYENGQGTKRDYHKAAKLYADAADNGDAKGRAFLGEMYYSGKGINVDKKQGIELYKQAAAMGSNYAKERLEDLGIKNDKIGDAAYVAYLKKDYKGAIKIWKKRALGGDVAAMVNLGHVFKGAKSVQDYKQAKAWYELADMVGNSEAMVALGDMYNYGMGMPTNYAKAYKLYSDAVMKDDPEGVYMFATMYDDGHGVEQDKEKALQLYQVAADMGSADAKSMLKFYRKKDADNARWEQMVANLDAIRARVARQKRECEDLAYRGNLEASRRSGQYHTYRYKPPTRCLGANMNR